MAKNLRALTDEELEYIVNNYVFELKGQDIMVMKKGYGLKTLHTIDKSFSLKTKLRRVTISKDAIDLWIEKYQSKYSLIEVQAAISRLIVTYQDLTEDEIAKQLEKSNKNIKKLTKAKEN